MYEYIITAGLEDEESVIDFYADDSDFNPKKDKATEFCTKGDAMLLICKAIADGKLNIEQLASEHDEFGSNIIGFDLIDLHEQPIISYTFNLKSHQHRYDNDRRSTY